MALPHVKHVFRCTVLKLVHIWRFMLSKGLLPCYFQICILRKMCEGSALCMKSQSWAILSVRTLGVDSRTSNGSESEKERKGKKTRRPCAANAGISPCLWHQGLARAGPFLLSEWLRDGWARSLWLLLCVRVSDRAVWAKTKGGVAHSCPETSLWRKSMRELRQQWR